MHRSLPTVCLLLLLSAFSDARAQDIGSLDTLRWILGDWAQTDGQTRSRETWKELDRNVFKGVGMTIDSTTGAKKSEESLMLAEMSGRIYFFAKVDHNKYPVPFELTSSSARHAVFENTGHDFPKKLEYQLVGDDALNVIVSDGDARSFSVGYKKKPVTEEKNTGG